MNFNKDGASFSVMNEWVKLLPFMLTEYYKFSDTWINVNSLIKYSHDKKRGIYYDLEHKFPIPSTTEPPSYTKDFINMAKEYDYVLCFQIENYEYYKAGGIENKFRFVPLRYASCFEQFVENKTYQERPFDIQFECTVDTQLRHNVLEKLTQNIVKGYLGKLHILMTNIDDVSTKYKLKNLAKYGIDFPHYRGVTINTFRIWEYVCMNMPVILIDYNNVGTTKYFDDFIVKKLDNTFKAKDIKDICKIHHEYNEAEKFKQMTQSDINYDNYRISIIKDFSDKYHVKIPDTVLLNDFCD